jgi:non-ribosomal peptide synthetase component F
MSWMLKRLLSRIATTGQEGELYVAGPTLAREYVGLESLTAERFPTIHGVRMYKTGDRARVLPNRELEILGRCVIPWWSK